MTNDSECTEWHLYDLSQFRGRVYATSQAIDFWKKRVPNMPQCIYQYTLTLMD